MPGFLSHTGAVMRREMHRLTHQPMYFVLMVVLPVVSFAFFALLFNKGAIRNIPIAVLDEDHTTLSRKVAQMIDDTPTAMVAYDIQSMAEGERLIYATHGHVYNTAHLPPLQPGDILLHGHTHVPAWQAFGEGNLYLNPGSVSLPKENSPHSYLTLEGRKFLWKELDGTVYHELNI